MLMLAPAAGVQDKRRPRHGGMQAAQHLIGRESAHPRFPPAIGGLRVVRDEPCPVDCDQDGDQRDGLGGGRPGVAGGLHDLAVQPRDHALAQVGPLGRRGPALPVAPAHAGCDKVQQRLRLLGKSGCDAIAAVGEALREREAVAAVHGGTAEYT